ncbi:MAG: flap endonuclease-1 [Candidatus Marsarchaeota archaeon]|nr:flap endonuclease-1 [Candidatus Marsarchaeota archaeon]
MAVDLSKLAVRNKIDIEELRGKTVAIDAFNVLYQFISIIRQPDGTPLHDSHGNVTSHLSGIFYRTAEIIEKGIRPVYVFDGIPSKLKERTINARIRRREQAYADWQRAVSEGNIEAAKSFAEQSSRVDRRIVESAKELLGYMGVPYISAPSEGEAQASYMCREGVVYAAGSQDYDTLLFGSKVVIRNLTLSGRRKLPRKNVYVNVSTERVDLEETLRALGIDQKRLIWIGMMLGTDFNTGIKGIGPKTALKIVKTVNSIEELESYLKERHDAVFDTDVREVEDLFLNPEITEITSRDLESLFNIKPDVGKIVEFMCDRHDFGRDRIERFANELSAKRGTRQQRGLGSWV